ncbi:MAG: hypothetical protein HY651_04765 [Acidobacteria bacterium]|nr:hypothetical protein [Acidobacteriota bacterium]
MKKAIVIILGFGILLSTLAIAQNGPTGPAGKSNTAHLYLFEKDNTTWQIVPEGAWGKMRYNLSGPSFDFVFNGHRLLTGDNYTLIYAPDPWPQYPLFCFGSGTVDSYGNIHIAGSAQPGDLPIVADSNYPGGAKLWLVWTSDVDCTLKQFVGWNGTEYLFEYNKITFDQTP